MSEIIQVVDTSIFEQKLKMAEIVLPFVFSMLKSKKNIATFLNVSTLTVSNMIKDKRLKEDVHYVLVGEKERFIPIAIVDYKLNPPTVSKAKKPYQPSQEAKDLLS